MESIYDKYEPVIGLEVHAQLSTQSKAYSTDSAAYGGAPNTHISPISLGHPGTLPKPNLKVIEYAVKLGLAVKANIRKRNEYARKNYFYADLPKGYQITQHNTPICNGGYIEIKTEDGKDKKIHLTRIHMEEDSGKSIHDLDPFYTLIDLNRAGVPLLEIVSEPEIANSTEAYNYLSEIRKLVRYLDICDGNMEEGSLRCDANVSVRVKGQKAFGTKVEVKNINSISNVKRALEYEIKRQIEHIENGGTIVQETRNFDAAKGSTTVMRTKEDAHDYRYFTEPDLAPVVLEESYFEKVKSQLPALPNELYRKYIHEMGLPEYDAAVLTESKEVAFFFEEILKHSPNAKAASNWVMGPIKNYLNERAVHITDFPLAGAKIAEIIALIDSNTISFSAASQTLFPKMLENPMANAGTLAAELNLIQESNTDQLEEWVAQAVAMYPEKVDEYRSGKKGLIGLFMGEVMKMSKGKADPKRSNELLRTKLES